MKSMHVVLGQKYEITPSYYDGWYIDEKTGEPMMYLVYDEPTEAKILKMFGFDILWGNNPPPDKIKNELLGKFQPVPVKVSLLGKEIK